MKLQDYLYPKRKSNTREDDDGDDDMTIMHKTHTTIRQKLYRSRALASMQCGEWEKVLKNVYWMRYTERVLIRENAWMNDVLALKCFC